MPYADKEEQRRYVNNWMKRRRTAWLEEHGPCIDCGSWSNLEVDHDDPSQKVTHRIWSWSKVRREAELAKCVVRCRPCHHRKSGTENRIRNLAKRVVGVVFHQYEIAKNRPPARPPIPRKPQMSIKEYVRLNVWGNTSGAKECREAHK